MMGQGVSMKMLLQVIVAAYGALGMVERALSGNLAMALIYGVFFATGLRGAVSVWKEEHPQTEAKEEEPDQDDYSYEAVRARWYNLQLEEKEDEERSVSDEHAFLYYQKQIDELNEAIPDYVISDRLYRLSGRLWTADKVEKDHPEDKETFRKMKQHYLPLMLSILRQYKKLQDAPGNREKEDTAEDLCHTIDMINAAMDTVMERAEEIPQSSRDNTVKEGTLSQKRGTGETDHE